MHSRDERGRLPVLDGIRGLAVLVVVVHNSAWIGRKADTLAAKLFTAAAASGWVGVQLFFVLSGFLITAILLDSVGRPDYFSRFYIRRSLRIFPLYYAVLGVSVLVAFRLRATNDLAAHVVERQAAYWLYLSNWIEPFGRGVTLFAHLWSLAIEEQFYLVWPAVVWLLGSRRLTLLCVGLVCTGPLVRLGLHAAGFPSGALYSFTVARWDALATGALTAIIVRDANRARVFLPRLPRAAAVLVALLVALALRQHGFHGGELPVQLFGQTLISLLSAALLFWAIAEASPQTGPLRRLFSHGILPQVGTYSYAIYLLHYPLHRLLQPSVADWVNAAAGAAYVGRLVAYCSCIVGLAYLAARVTWLLVERPCLRLKDRITPALSVRFSAMDAAE
jgi:peptidoglycan/LPS O-acetylase OafA/YrhL